MLKGEEEKSVLTSKECIPGQMRMKTNVIGFHSENSSFPTMQNRVFLRILEAAGIICIEM